MLGARCEYGEDYSNEGRDHKPRDGYSFLAFDFRRELLAIRAALLLPQDSLPPALSPLDAELSFDDISSQGIHIKQGSLRKASRQNGQTEDQIEVTVTVTCRRPPKFYAKLERNIDGSARMESNGRRYARHRRATALDFAITGVVSGFWLILAEFRSQRRMRDRYKPSLKVHVHT